MTVYQGHRSASDVVGWICTTLLLGALLIAHAARAEPPAVVIVPAGELDPTDPMVTAEIKGFEYEPAELRIMAGTTVVWTNRDRFDHDVMVLSAGSPAQEDVRHELVGVGGKMALTFHVPGAYSYICSVHPFMQAVVIVESPGEATAGNEQPEPAQQSPEEGGDRVRSL
jgi:plastocyanin